MEVSSISSQAQWQSTHMLIARTPFIRSDEFHQIHSKYWMVHGTSTAGTRSPMMAAEFKSQIPDLGI